jgi:hypothetical protein
MKPEDELQTIFKTLTEPEKRRKTQSANSIQRAIWIPKEVDEEIRAASQRAAKIGRVPINAIYRELIKEGYKALKQKHPNLFNQKDEQNQ